MAYVLTRWTSKARGVKNSNYMLIGKWLTVPLFLSTLPRG